MNLKKSDKIIAIVGVLILVIAAIGIVLYTSTEEVEEKEPEEKLLTFDVYEEVKTGSAERETYKFNKLKLVTKVVSLEEKECFPVSVDNLKSVEFKITYEDDRTGRLLGKILNKVLGLKIGKDTLTITIIDPDGTEHKGESIVGSGNTTITFDGINPPIYTEQIEAETDVEAMEELEYLYGTKWKDGVFKIKAELSSKEAIPLLDGRLLEKLDDDDFTLEITYTYYDYDLEEIEDDDKETVTVITSSSFIKTTGFLGRDWFG